jgi:hypothetical protein
MRSNRCMGLTKPSRSQFTRIIAAAGRRNKTVEQELTEGTEAGKIVVLVVVLVLENRAKSRTRTRTRTRAAA